MADAFGGASSHYGIGSADAGLFLAHADFAEHQSGIGPFQLGRTAIELIAEEHGETAHLMGSDRLARQEASLKFLARESGEKFMR
jgi:hypothetical protein